MAEEGEVDRHTYRGNGDRAGHARGWSPHVAVGVSELGGVFYAARSVGEACLAKRLHPACRLVERECSRGPVGVNSVPLLPDRPQPVDVGMVQEEDRVVW